MLHANYYLVLYFFAFQKKSYPTLILIYPPSSLYPPVHYTFGLNKFSLFLHILYKDQIKLILMPIQWSLKTGLVAPCIYYTRTKVNLYFPLYTPIFFGKQDNLSCFTFTHLDSSFVALSVILVAKVEVSIPHSCKVKPSRFLSKSPSTIYGDSIWIGKPCIMNWNTFVGNKIHNKPQVVGSTKGDK